MTWLGEQSDRVLEIARKRYWREADARVVVRAWRESGARVTAFARAHGLRPRRVTRWISRFGKADQGAVRFYPVRVVGELERQRVSRDPIEVVMVDGTRVRVPEGFGVDHLRRVLEVLEQATPC